MCGRRHSERRRTWTQPAPSAPSAGSTARPTRRGPALTAGSRAHLLDVLVVHGVVGHLVAQQLYDLLQLVAVTPPLADDDHLVKQEQVPGPTAWPGARQLGQHAALPTRAAASRAPCRPHCRRGPSARLLQEALLALLPPWPEVHPGSSDPKLHPPLDCEPHGGQARICCDLSTAPGLTHSRCGYRTEQQWPSCVGRRHPRHWPGHCPGHLAKSSRSHSACPALGSLRARQPRPLAAPQPNPMPAAGRAAPRLWPPLAGVARREGRKQLKQSHTKPGGRAALSSGKAVPRPAGSGVPGHAGRPPPGAAAPPTCPAWCG